MTPDGIYINFHFLLLNTSNALMTDQCLPAAAQTIYMHVHLNFSICLGS